MPFLLRHPKLHSVPLCIAISPQTLLLHNERLGSLRVDREYELPKLL